MKRSLLSAISLLFFAAISQPATAADDPILDTARQIEVQLDARVGLAIFDTGSGNSWFHNADERFAMGSTFKAMACAAVLARVDTGELNLEATMSVAQTDLVTYSPVAEQWVGQEVSLGTFCEVTMRTSDNTAANKVLEALGGPEGVSQFVHSLGDSVTRLDRWETELNTATPGDPRDTTSPAAIASSLREVVLGDALSPSSRDLLTAWLVGNEVGGPLLRAGIPNDWRIGDRTGAGGHGSRGVIAVIWPPERAPLVAAIYITQTDASMEQRNEAIAAIGSTIADVISSRP